MKHLVGTGMNHHLGMKHLPGMNHLLDPSKKSFWELFKTESHSLFMHQKCNFFSMNYKLPKMQKKKKKKKKKKKSTRVDTTA